MGNKYGSLLSKPTPQSKSLRGREKEMVKNDAGGYVFALDKWKMLERFLILGSESSTYYVGQSEHFERNNKTVNACIAEDPQRVLDMAIDISVNGRAHKNDPAEFVLAALASVEGNTRKIALQAMPKIIRTGRTLLEFNILLNKFGMKWGSARRAAFGNWYTSKTADNAAYQIIKYPTASGWTHLDILRHAHRTQTDDASMEALFRYLAKKEYDAAALPEIVRLWEMMKAAKTEKEVVKLIKNNSVLTWEFVPGEWQGKKNVWEALLPNLPYTALIRNLGRFTNYGILNGVNDEVKLVRDKLTDRDGLRRARVHPVSTLIAWRTYSNGGASNTYGRESKLTWQANKQIEEALEDAFYLGFDVIEPTNKNFLFAIDVSGSMSVPMWNYGASAKSPMGSIPISCAEAAAVMAMVSIRSEPNSVAMGFSSQFKDLKIGRKDSLDAVMKKVQDRNFGSTDCAVPMLHALNNGMEFDEFVVLTDNETWAGNIHPSEALVKYRNYTGIHAKLIVVGMLSSGFSIADPKDDGMLDVVGFDTSVPSVISQFARG